VSVIYDSVRAYRIQSHLTETEERILRFMEKKFASRAGTSLLCFLGSSFKPTDATMASAQTAVQHAC